MRTGVFMFDNETLMGCCADECIVGVWWSATQVNPDRSSRLSLAPSQHFAAGQNLLKRRPWQDTSSKHLRRRNSNAHLTLSSSDAPRPGCGVAIAFPHIEEGVDGG